MEDRGGVNMFANDGSFMEMFRKKMEEGKQGSVSSPPAASPKQEIGSASTSSSSITAGEVSDPASQRVRPHDSERDNDEDRVPSRSADGRLSAETVGDSPGRARTSPRTDAARHQSSSSSSSGLDGSEPLEGALADDRPDAGAVASATSDVTVPKPKKYSLLSHVGKRRDGKMTLKTGAVKKQRLSDAEASKDQDPWSKYMAEVEKYKAHVCGDEDKSRPLVK